MFPLLIDIILITCKFFLPCRKGRQSHWSLAKEDRLLVGANLGEFAVTTVISLYLFQAMPNRWNC